jgi:Carbohydrate binding domain
MLDSNHSNSSGGPGGRWAFLFAAVIVAAACNFLFFWQFFVSHFDLILADLGDGRLCIAFLEHWFHFFKGREPIASPLYFYPEQGVLGYSEALFLYALPYAASRALGLGPLLSFEFSLMIVKMIGFASMILLLRRSLKLDRWVALFGAALFTLSNIHFASSGHVQLAAVAFVPTLLWLGSESYTAMTRGRAQTALWLAAVAGLLLAALFITSFYIAWFAVLFFSAFVAISFLLTSGVGRVPLASILAKFWRPRMAIAVFVIAFAAGLIPFCLIYLPAISKTGHRSIEETLYFMPRPIDIVNTGPANAVWGGLVRKVIKIDDPIVAAERAIGWPLLTLIFSFGFGVAELWKLRSSKSARERVSRGIASALILTSALIWIFQIKFHNDFTLWRLIYHAVPGATAIRVTGRMSLITNAGFVLLITLAVGRLWTARLNRVLGIAAVLITVLALAEQLNFGSTHNISRREERHRFAKIRQPPSSCSSFVAIRNISGNALELQTDAVTVANRFEIPTMNGYSAWKPAGWNLFNLSDASELNEARWWAASSNITTGACVLDLSSGLWSPTLGRLPDVVSSGITDGGFELADVSDWTRYQEVRGEASSARAHSGKQSLEEIKGAGSFYQDVIGLQPGHTYSVTAWVSGSTDGEAAAQIAVYDPTANVATFSPSLRATPEWRLITHSFTLSTAEMARSARIHLFRVDAPGILFWDDVTLYEAAKQVPLAAEAK